MQSLSEVSAAAGLLTLNLEGWGLSLETGVCGHHSTTTHCDTPLQLYSSNDDVLFNSFLILTGVMPYEEHHLLHSTHL